jgi:hypothetical protein
MSLPITYRAEQIPLNGYIPNFPLSFLKGQLSPVHIPVFRALPSGQ